MERYTTILNDDIQLRLYPLESVLAEKLQTILARAENNSRSKDFYDIYTIMRNNEKRVDIEALKISVDLTFAYRKTHILKMLRQILCVRLIIMMKLRVDGIVIKRKIHMLRILALKVLL